MTLVTVGVGAQASPRYAPAGLLVMRAGLAALDGGLAPPFGEFARDGQMFRPGRPRRS